MKTVVRVIPHGLGLINSDENQKIRVWSDDAFGNLAICKEFEYQSGADYCVLVYRGEELVSFAAVLKREIKVDGKSLVMGGVGGVITDPSFRQMGYASIAMKESLRIIFSALRADIGGLLCLGETSRFYSNLGWIHSNARAKIRKQDQVTEWPESFMFYCRDDEKLSPVDVDLCGLPW
jgi:hypothetical protein